jgi:hypothetical protein
MAACRRDGVRTGVSRGQRPRMLSQVAAYWWSEVREVERKGTYQVVSPQRALALSKAMSFEKSKMRARLLACWGMGAGRIVCDGKSQAKIET